MNVVIKNAVSLPEGCVIRLMRSEFIWSGDPASDGLELVLALDIDFTVVDSTAVGAAEKSAHQQLAVDNHLPEVFFGGVRVDFKSRDFDLANMVEALILRGLENADTPSDVRQVLEQLTPQQVLEISRAHHESILEVEKHAAGCAYPNVATALRALKERFPKLRIVAHTDCPAWLGLLRLHNAGLLQFYDGIMGCDVLEPTWLRESEFSVCASESRRWTDEVISSLLKQYPNVRVVAAASVPACKPSHVGLQVLLSDLGVSPDSVVCHLDDKPIGAGVIAGLRTSGTTTNAYCLHAEYGYGKLADWAGVDVRLQDFGDAVEVVADIAAALVPAQ